MCWNYTKYTKKNNRRIYTIFFVLFFFYIRCPILIILVCFTTEQYIFGTFVLEWLLVHSSQLDPPAPSQTGPADGLMWYSAGHISEYIVLNV